MKHVTISNYKDPTKKVSCSLCSLCLVTLWLTEENKDTCIWPYANPTAAGKLRLGKKRMWDNENTGNLGKKRMWDTESTGNLGKKRMWDTESTGNLEVAPQ